MNSSTCVSYSKCEVCVVCFSYCNNFTLAKYVRGYISRKKRIAKLDVLLNITSCYCKLATSMAVFITSKGGTNKFVVEFVISSDYLKPRIDASISLLDNTSSYLSIDALDFFRLWYTEPYVIEGFLYHPSSYVGYGKKLGKRKRGVRRQCCEFHEKEVQSAFQRPRGFSPSTIC